MSPAVLLLASALAIEDERQAVSGRVLDPQALPVSHARVALECRGLRQTTVTGDDGGFVFDVTAITSTALETCRLVVRLDGFLTESAAAVRQGERTIVTLTVAPIAQAIDVHADRPKARTTGRASVADEDLRRVAGSTADLIRHARSLAGVSTLASVVYVDGLPSRTLPPIDEIASITVNDDRFSAEFADGDVAIIGLVTRAPSRVLRFRAGSDALGIGGQDVLQPGLHSRSRLWNLGASGPVPETGLTLSFSSTLSRTDQDLSFQAVTPPDAAHSERAARAASESRSGAGVGRAYYARGGFNGQVSYSRSQYSASNVGVGGLTLPDAGSSSTAVTQELRATFTAVTPRVTFQGGTTVHESHSTIRANTLAPGVIVRGAFVAGGSPTLASESRRTRWTAKQVVRSTSTRPWALGVVLQGVQDDNHETPNRGGTLEFESLEAYERARSGEATAIWFVTRGEGIVRYGDVTVSPFFQQEFLRTARLTLGGGLRADYQTGLGTLLSPRLSMAARARGFTLRGGGGLFVRSASDLVFMRVRRAEAAGLQDFMVVGTPSSTLGDAVGRTPVRLEISEDFTQSRQRLLQISVDRTVGSLAAGIDVTVTRETRLAGSDRTRTDAGWTDVIASDRAAVRERLHAMCGYEWGRQRIVAHYEWVRSRDNTDGPFSYPARSGDMAGEWARSAGVSPHNVTIVGTFQLPAGIWLTVTDSWNSSAPFNVVSGLGVTGNGLASDRGGRQRNSADGPSHHSTSVYAYRRLALPRGRLRGAAPAHLGVGVQADNLFGQRNYSSVGSIAGSPTFGKPLAATPSRSVRVLLNVD